MTEISHGLARLETEHRVATLTLMRSEKRNALSIDLLEALHGAVDELRGRREVSVVVLRGDGRSFCAGMDLRAVLGDPGAPLRLLSSIAELSLALRGLPQVVIARAHGAAIGGGCGLVVGADIAVTHPDAKLGFPEVDLGVCPAVVAPLLVNKVGAGVARRIFLTGGTLSGLDASRMGLVDHCVPVDEMDGVIAEIAERIAGAGPEAIAATKRHLGELDGERFAALVRRGAEISAEVIAGAEAQSRLGQLYGS